MNLRAQMQRLGRQSAIYGLSSVLGASATMILVPLLTRHLSTLQYGMLEVLTVFVTQAGVLVQLGLGSALFRFVLQTNPERDDPALIISTAYWTIVVTAGLGVAGAMFAAPGLGTLLLGEHNDPGLVRWMLLKIFFEAIGVVPMARLRIREAAVTYGAVSASRLFIALGFVVIALQLADDPLRGVVIASSVEAGCFALVATATARKDLVLRLSSRALRGMLSFGLPLIPYAFILTILAVGDRYFLRTFGGLAEVGPYAVGYKLAAVLAIPVRAFQVAWPTFLFSLADTANGRTFYAKVLVYLLLALGFGALALGIFAREIVDIAAGDAFARAYVVVPVLLAAQISLGVFYATAVGTNLSGKTHLVTLAAVAGLAVFGGAGLLLVPRFGMLGAAWATALGYFTMAVTDWALSIRLYPVPYEWKRIIGLVVLTGGLMLLGVRIDTGRALLDAGMKAAVLVAYPLLLFFLGFLSPGERAAFRRVYQRVAVGPAKPEAPGGPEV